MSNLSNRTQKGKESVEAVIFCGCFDRIEGRKSGCSQERVYPSKENTLHVGNALEKQE